MDFIVWSTITSCNNSGKKKDLTRISHEPAWLDHIGLTTTKIQQTTLAAETISG